MSMSRVCEKTRGGVSRKEREREREKEIMPPREKKTRAPCTKESSFSEGFGLDLYILIFFY